MSAEFNLTANVTIRGRNVANSERGDFANSQACVNREYEGKSVALGVASGIDDAKHTSNFRVGQHARLTHDYIRFAE